MRKKFLLIFSILLSACAQNYYTEHDDETIKTPNVDQIENMDVYSTNKNDKFLQQLAMNYKSYAIYNARTSGYYEVGEIFAKKTIKVFSGELVVPERVSDWLNNTQNDVIFEFNQAYDRLNNKLKRDISDECPELAAEAQAKFDCWLSSYASEQFETANECKKRFNKSMSAIENGYNIGNTQQTTNRDSKTNPKQENIEDVYYPETRDFLSTNIPRGREGLVIVNNVNIPPTMNFSQNIFPKYNNCTNGNCENSNNNSNYITRDEFEKVINDMRDEFDKINKKLDNLQNAVYEKATLKIEKTPSFNDSKLVEELLEIRFDFNKSEIKEEYKPAISKLAKSMRHNSNIKVSILGHTDRAGTNDYNFALGGRRAKVVKQKLIKLGIPKDQISIASVGEENNKVVTQDGVANAENRRVVIEKQTKIR